MPFAPEIIQRTREHFADIGQKCIAAASAGEFYVNDLPSYIEWQKTCIENDMTGANDHTFTFRQMAHFFQTGECVPLFAPDRKSA